MGYIGHRDIGGNGVQGVWDILAMRFTGGMGYRGIWGTWAIGARGYGVQGVWVTSAIGHMANGAHGQWGSWAMGSMGNLNIFAHNIIKLDILTHLTYEQKCANCPWAPLPIGPVAHRPHCPCAPLAM